MRLRCVHQRWQYIYMSVISQLFNQHSVFGRSPQFQTAHEMFSGVLLVWIHRLYLSFLRASRNPDYLQLSSSNILYNPTNKQKRICITSLDLKKQFLCSITTTYQLILQERVRHLHNLSANNFSILFCAKIHNCQCQHIRLPIYLN